jgi:hypothetical protein
MWFMKKAIRITISVFLAIFTFLVIYLNSALYYQPSFRMIGKVQVNTDALAQLRFLENEIHRGAGDKMQQIYPEGNLFMLALYSISWSELASGLPPDSGLYREAHREMDWAVKEIYSEKTKDLFDSSLLIPYGAFYTGWSSYALGKKLLTEKPGERDTGEVILFRRQCAWVAEFIERGQSPYPETYADFSWPADGVVCLASLALYDSLFGPLYQNRIREWIAAVRNHVDYSGMIPHLADANTGKSLIPAQGSSMSLMLNFLYGIDRDFAAEQFVLYRENFLDSRFGLPGIREYRKGTVGEEHIDSGPIVLQIGGAATIAGMRAMMLFGDRDNATGIRNGVEALGIPTESSGEKKYLLGYLPMADAFIAWAATAEKNATDNHAGVGYWNMRFQLYSALALLFAGGIFLRTWRIKPFRKKNEITERTKKNAPV